MSFAANDIWSSWSTFVFGVAPTVTLTDGVLRMEDASSAGSGARYKKLTLKGGDKVRIECMGRAISGQGKLYINLNSLPGTVGGEKLVGVSSEFSMKSIDYVVPHIYSAVDVYIGIGTTGAELGVVEYFAPTLYVNGAEVSSLAFNDFGIFYAAGGATMNAFGVPIFHVENSGSNDKRIAIYRPAIGGNAFATFGSLNPILRLVGNTNDTSTFGLATAANTANGATQRFLKTRSATMGGLGATQSGDGLGAIDFFGDNGSAYVRGARIEVLQDAAVAAGGRIPTKVSIRITTNGTLDQEALIINDGAVRPGLDAGFNFGSAGLRWNNSFFMVAPTITSDERTKEDICAIDDLVLDAWASIDYQQYRIREAVAEKGADARIHFGVIAQHIEEAFANAGLDAFRYGVLCHDEWDERPEVWEEIAEEFDEEGNLVKAADRVLIQAATPGGERYGVRYEEALALESALMRRTTMRLEERLAQLESA